MKGAEDRYATMGDTETTRQIERRAGFSMTERGDKRLKGHQEAELKFLNII